MLQVTLIANEINELADSEDCSFLVLLIISSLQQRTIRKCSILLYEFLLTIIHYW